LHSIRQSVRSDETSLRTFDTTLKVPMSKTQQQQDSLRYKDHKTEPPRCVCGAKTRKIDSM